MLRLACLLASFSLIGAVACGGSGDKVDENGVQALQDAMANMSSLPAFAFDSETTVTGGGDAAQVSQIGRVISPDMVYAEITRPRAPLLNVVSVDGVEYVQHTGSDWRCYNVVATPLTEFGFNPPDFETYAALIDEATSVSVPRDKEADGQSIQEVELRLSSHLTDAAAVAFGGLVSLATAGDSFFKLVFSIDDQGRVGEIRASADVKPGGQRVKIEIVQRFSDANPAEGLPLKAPYPTC